MSGLLKGRRRFTVLNIVPILLSILNGSGDAHSKGEMMRTTRSLDQTAALIPEVTHGEAGAREGLSMSMPRP